MEACKLEDNKFWLRRSGLVITHRCTLKCKLCGGYIPYYVNPTHITVERLNKIVDRYFLLVDKVSDFSITGGEPLMHPELNEIAKKVLQYKNQIDRMLILTNGTLLLKENVLRTLAENREKCMVTISDYGEHSPKASDLKNQLDQWEIPCRVIDYYSSNLFCDGWVDYGDHSLKHLTQEDRDEQARNCMIRNRGIIEDGELHSCARSYYRMKNSIIPKSRNEYVDLLADDFSVEEGRSVLKSMFESSSSTSCAYCSGLCKDSKRYKPAEQL